MKIVKLCLADYVKVCGFAGVCYSMEFRSHRGRGSADSHGDSSGSRRREDKPVRSKRRTADDDRSFYRHSHADTHKISSVDSTSKESSADSRRSAGEISFHMFDKRLQCTKSIMG